MASPTGDNGAGSSEEGQLQPGGLPKGRLLGRGLSSSVYETTWKGKRFARKDFVGVPSEIFVREAKALVRLQDHENLVKTYGWTVDERECSLLTEYVEDDLMSLLQKRGVQSDFAQPMEALDIILQLATGMKCLHTQGIAHGDLKPKSVLVAYRKDGSGSKVVKVTNHGLVRTKRNVSVQSSVSESKLDIVRWKAPEYFKILFRQPVDGASAESGSDLEHPGSNLLVADIYSFAVTCSQILTGKDPYPNLVWTDLGFQVSHGMIEPSLPDQVCPQLRELLVSCWGDPANRPSFSTICERLKELKASHIPDVFEGPGAANDSTFGAEPLNESSGSGTVPVSIDKSSDISRSEISSAPELPSVQKRKSNKLSFKSLVNGETSEKAAQIGAQCLISPLQVEVFRGFEILLHCASNMPDGRRAVFNATCIRPPSASPEKAISIALQNLENPHYSKYAMKLVVALTSEGGAGSDRDRINEEVAKGLDLLISIMKAEGVTKTRLLAAEAIANILVYKEVRIVVRSHHGVVAAFVGFANVSDILKPDLKRRADAVCLKGLQRLANRSEEGSDEMQQIAHCSEEEQKTRKIVVALIQLLRTGLGFQPELTSLVEDSLVALKSQLREMDNDVIRMMISKEMSRLLVADKFEAHTTVPGRMAIISMMSKLCGLYEDRNCQKHVVSAKLEILVARFKRQGGIDALVTLLKDSDSKCQQEFALIALRDLLSLNVKLPEQQLSFESVLKFLTEVWPDEVKEAAAALSDLMFKDDPVVCADKFMETERALEATLSLLKNDPDGPGGVRIASLLLGIAKEKKDACCKIAESGLHGLDTLVKYVQDHVKDESDRNKLKKLLSATLVRFCKSGNSCQEAVIEANGHVFLVTSLQEEKKEVLKEKVAQGLLELLKNIEIREKVLETTFVTAAMDIIDADFACPDIALGLALISSDPKGLTQIYSNSRSVSALLTLLQHCRDPKGKNAAASVIARLYLRLDGPEDSALRRRIAESCGLFSKYLERVFRTLENSEVSHITEFLEALAMMIPAEINGKKTFHECRVDELLIDNLQITQTDVQVLMLKILVVMSSDSNPYAVCKIRHSFLDEHKIADKLFPLLKSRDSRTEIVKHALMLIRNLSLVGNFSELKLGDEGSISLLLEIIKRHERPVSDVTGLAIKALEKFLDDPNAKQVTLNEKQVLRRKKVVFLTGKQVFLEAKGVETLARILKHDVDGPSKSSDATCYSTAILAAVAGDQQTREVACKEIFKCGILQALNETMFHCKTTKMRWQAAVLLKLLVMYGPTNQVCTAMKEAHCLHALRKLRKEENCNEIAEDTLNYVSSKSEVC